MYTTDNAREEERNRKKSDMDCLLRRESRLFFFFFFLLPWKDETFFFLLPFVFLQIGKWQVLVFYLWQRRKKKHFLFYFTIRPYFSEAKSMPKKKRLTKIVSEKREIRLDEVNKNNCPQKIKIKNPPFVAKDSILILTQKNYWNQILRRDKDRVMFHKN